MSNRPGLPRPSSARPSSSGPPSPNRGRRLALVVFTAVAIPVAIAAGPVAWHLISTRPGDSPSLAPRELDSLAWRIRVLRWGEAEGAAQGRAVGASPAYGTVVGAFDRGDPCGVWTADGPSGEPLWSGIAFGGAEWAGEVSRIIELEGIAIEIEHSPDHTRWRPVDLPSWIDLDFGWPRDVELLAVVRDEAGGCAIGAVTVGATGRPVRRGPAHYFLRADGSIERIELPGHMVTRFDERERIVDQVVSSPDREWERRTGPPWIDVLSGIDPGEPVRHPRTGEILERSHEVPLRGD